MERLRNPIRQYAWGSRSVIAHIQGRPVPSASPEAELWIGAHPSAPSTLERSCAATPGGAAGGPALTGLITASPAEVLSDHVYARFGARLPYLLKLLAAESPLSLQAHPDAVLAAEGYAAEQAAAVPAGASHRRYADPHHKPELLVAVTKFRALCGFRDPGASATLIAQLGVPALDPVAEALRGRDLRTAVRSLLRSPPSLVAEAAAAAVTAAAPAGGENELVGELAAAYPDDPGVVVALLLNQVTLAPGEAIFMPAGSLHGYLHGTGVEIMAASDNVLRGGLTRKHVDVPELLRVLRFEPLPDPVRAPEPVAPGVVTWPVPVAEFVLHRVRLGPTVPRVELTLAGPREVLCLTGEVRVDDGVAPVTLRPGEAGFGAAGRPKRGGCGGHAAGPLRLDGAGEAYVASVGPPE